VKPFHLSRYALSVVLAVLAVMFGDVRGGLAQGKLDARYTVTLSGIPVGRGAWVIDLQEDHFTAAASGTTAGLLRIFASGHGQSSVRGSVTGGQPIPSIYSSSIDTDNSKYDQVRMVISAGNVKEYVADPPTVASPDRVPLTAAHRRGVVDPMTGSLMLVPGNGDTFVPQACPQHVAIFDGRMRYDLHLAFKRLDKVKAERGYQGRVVVCSVRFVPIAGHVPARAAIKYLTDLRDMEMWLAPIAGTRVMVPYRFSVPTPIGDGVLQATQFVSIPQPAKAAAKSQ
jgi:Protein of unknown function (DUF3108)